MLKYFTNEVKGYAGRVYSENEKPSEFYCSGCFSDVKKDIKEELKDDNSDISNQEIKDEIDSRYYVIGEVDVPTFCECGEVLGRLSAEGKKKLIAAAIKSGKTDIEDEDGEKYCYFAFGDDSETGLNFEELFELYSMDFKKIYTKECQNYIDANPGKKLINGNKKMKNDLNEAFEVLAKKYLKEYRQMSGDPFWMVAKYPGRTKDGVAFKKGDDILWWPRTKTAMIGQKAEQAWREFQAQAEDEDVYAGGYGSMNEGMSNGRKLIKDAKLKNGDIIPSGTPVAVEFYADQDDKKGERICKLHIKFTGESGRNYEDEPMQVYISNLPKTVSGFKEPSAKTMEKWMYDAIALTPTGKRVEPDGYGPDGSPSWLLALGLI